MSIDLIKNYTSNIEQEMFDKKRILDAYDKYGKELFYSCLLYTSDAADE